jgi:hypothetical protein
MRNAVAIGFAVIVFVVAGLGFVFKMSEFATTIVKDEIEGFNAVCQQHAGLTTQKSHYRVR